jgi:hypothetical protein
MTGLVNSPILTLEEFLKQPETKPASELVSDEIVSVLPGLTLALTVNQVVAWLKVRQ